MCSFATSTVAGLSSRYVLRHNFASRLLICHSQFRKVLAFGPTVDYIGQIELDDLVLLFV